MSEQRTDFAPRWRRGGGALSQRLADVERQAPPARRDAAEDVVERVTNRVESGVQTRVRRRGGDFVPSVLDVDEAPRSPGSRRVLIALFALFAAAFAWGYFGKITSDTTAAGRVQTAGRTKVLEALGKGQVTKIQARDGDKIKKGDVLVELDPTEAQAARTIVFDKLTDLRAENARRRAEIIAARVTRVDTSPKIGWTKDVPEAVRTREEDVMRTRLAELASTLSTLISQRTEKEAERDGLTAQITAQKALIAVTNENVAMIDSLLQKGWNSRAKFLDMKAQLENQQVQQTSMEGALASAKQAIVMIDSEIAKTREVFVTTNTQATATNEQAIVDLEQQLVKANQTLADMTLRSPVSGSVHASAITTIGQVVKPGDQLMQIVPDDTPLEIQAYVDNGAAGFIQVGQEAVIKVVAFQYSTYGAIDGTVVDVGKDSLAVTQKNTVQSSSLDGEYKSTTAAQKTGSLQFPITVRAKKNSMNVDGKEVPLVPGMAVNVELETERRRGLDYIVSPILELLSTAAHEK